MLSCLQKKYRIKGVMFSNSPAVKNYCDVVGITVISHYRTNDYGLPFIRDCLSGKRWGISARKLSLNKYKIFSVILPVQAMYQSSLQATCQPHCIQLVSMVKEEQQQTKMSTGADNNGVPEVYRHPFSSLSAPE